MSPKPGFLTPRAMDQKMFLRPLKHKKNENLKRLILGNQL